MRRLASATAPGGRSDGSCATRCRPTGARTSSTPSASRHRLLPDRDRRRRGRQAPDRAACTGAVVGHAATTSRRAPAPALFTTRRGGVSDGPFASLNLGLWTDDDPAARAREPRRAGRAAGRRADPCCRPARSTARASRWPPPTASSCRGRRPGDTPADVAPIVLAADCLPVALAAPGAVAMVHAGWRGLAAGVLGPACGGARSGAAGHRGDRPGSGPCCYEVGDEVPPRSRTSARRARGATWTSGASPARELEAAGVGASTTAACARSATTRAVLLASPRRRRTGRQAGVAWRS